MPKPRNDKTEVAALPDNDRRHRRRFSAADKGGTKGSPAKVGERWGRESFVRGQGYRLPQ